MAESVQDEIDKLVPPDKNFPLVNRVASIDPMSASIVQWILHKEHPLSPGFAIMRMYRRLTGVKIYSVRNDGAVGMLNFLPREQVRLTEELMHPNTLVAELAACEAGEDEKEPDEDDDDPDDEDTEEGDRATPVPGAAEPTTSNGPAVS